MDGACRNERKRNLKGRISGGTCFSCLPAKILEPYDFGPLFNPSELCDFYAFMLQGPRQLLVSTKWSRLNAVDTDKDGKRLQLSRMQFSPKKRERTEALNRFGSSAHKDLSKCGSADGDTHQTKVLHWITTSCVYKTTSA